MIFPLIVHQAPAPKPDPFAALRMLEGDWVGMGSGQPGEGKGGCTFRFELDGKAFVRRNWAEYPASKERSALRHEDLMVCSASGGSLRAVYWDSEGHRIDYTVTSPEAGLVVFLGEVQPGAPRFRLIYQAEGKEGLRLTFDVAPPDQPEAFKPYLQAKLHRK